VSLTWNDLLDSAGEGFDPVPDGQYPFTISKAEAAETKTGKTMFKTQHKIDGGPHNGRVVFNQFVLSPDSPSALGFFFRHMAAMGLDKQFFSKNPTKEQVAEALVGRRGIMKVSMRKYQGQDRNNVDAILPLGGGVPMAPAPASGPPLAVPTPPANGAVPAPPAVAAPAAPVAPPAAEVPAPPPIPQPEPIQQPEPVAEAPAGAPAPPF
jgi:hypothetical protein